MLRQQHALRTARTWGRPEPWEPHLQRFRPPLAVVTSPPANGQATPVLNEVVDSASRIAQLEAENADLRAQLDCLPEKFAQELERAKLESLKELAYGASHEINNPLANIAGRAQTLLKREWDADVRKALEAMQRQALRAHEMIADLMLFARPPALRRAPTNFADVARQVAVEISARAAERGIVITVQADDVMCDVDATQIAVALRALLDNSVEAIGQHGEIAVTVRRAGDSAEIVVRDTGPGISPAVREHLFDPFFSGREAGRGLGFGLSKCWRIVTDHGGEVLVGDGPGACFTLRLPC